MENGQLRDVIIIGGGPAGYTAAVYLARATLKPLVLAGEAAGGQLMWTAEVENYPGFSKGIMGPQLMEEMRAQAERFGAEIKNNNVTKLDLGGEVKRVWVGSTEYQTKSIILSLGAQARMLGIGEEKFLGRGVSTCAVCDAAFYKNKKVFVVGGGDAAMEDALALARFTDKVTLVHRKGELRASKIMQERVKNNPNIKLLLESEVVGFGGEEKLKILKIRNSKSQNTEEMEADGLFLAIGHTPITDLLRDQVELDGHGYLITELTSDKETNNQNIWLNSYPTQTSVKGVFGAGDMVDIRYRQAVTAAGMGCMAALDCEKYLTGNQANW